MRQEKLDHGRVWMKQLARYLRRHSTQMICVGAVSDWFRGGYSLEGVELLLDQLVAEGILREATPDESRSYGHGHGYFLEPGALSRLPPDEDHCEVH